MRLFILFFLAAISGCSIQGSLYESHGEYSISGGSEGLDNTRPVSLEFIAYNSFYENLKETVLWMEINDASHINVNNVGNIPFKIELQAKANKKSIYFSGDTRLHIGNSLHHPLKTVIGTFSFDNGCTVNPNLAYYKTEIKYSNDQYEKTCAIYWFDVETPSPKEEFSLSMHISDNGIEKSVYVNFHGVKREVFYH